MGYLNNSTRVLDAILTKKGREILSSGDDFNVTKFALGDDEVDYGLWDTTHTLGTDYYGTIIDNLPTLEPFNDPSEIMKYKLVSRSDGIQAMAKLIETAGSQTALNNLKWYADDLSGEGGTRVQVYDSNYYLGTGVQFGVGHVNNGALTVDYSGGEDSIWTDGYKGEDYTITLLDSTVAVMAPLYRTVTGREYPVTESKTNDNKALWYPLVKSVQHLSQTIKNIEIGSGGLFRHVQAELFGKGVNGALAIYPKKISAESSPAKTSLIITGQSSGVVLEFDITITYRATGVTPADDAGSSGSES